MANVFPILIFILDRKILHFKLGRLPAEEKKKSLWQTAILMFWWIKWNKTLVQFCNLYPGVSYPDDMQDVDISYPDETDTANINDEPRPT